ncbi:IgA FC receptor, partial [human gut metagenome]
DALKGYFEQYFLTPFNKIKQIVDDLDKKVEQDQPAPIPENSEMDQDKEKAKIAVSKYLEPAVLPEPAVYLEFLAYFSLDLFEI